MVDLFSRHPRALRESSSLGSEADAPYSCAGSAAQIPPLQSPPPRWPDSQGLVDASTLRRALPVDASTVPAATRKVYQIAEATAAGPAAGPGSFPRPPSNGVPPPAAGQEPLRKIPTAVSGIRRSRMALVPAASAAPHRLENARPCAELCTACRRAVWPSSTRRRGWLDQHPAGQAAPITTRDVRRKPRNTFREPTHRQHQVDRRTDPYTHAKHVQAPRSASARGARIRYAVYGGGTCDLAGARGG